MPDPDYVPGITTGTHPVDGWFLSGSVRIEWDASGRSLPGLPGQLGAWSPNLGLTTSKTCQDLLVSLEGKLIQHMSHMSSYVINKKHTVIKHDKTNRECIAALAPAKKPHGGGFEDKAMDQRLLGMVARLRVASRFRKAGTSRYKCLP